MHVLQMVIDTVSINISIIIIHLLRETEDHILPILNHLSARRFAQCFTAYIYFPFLFCFSFCCSSLMQTFLICDASRKCLAHYTWLGINKVFALSYEQKSVRKFHSSLLVTLSHWSLLLENYFLCRYSTQPQDFEVKPHK